MVQHIEEIRLHITELEKSFGSLNSLRIGVVFGVVNPKNQNYSIFDF